MEDIIKFFWSSSKKRDLSDTSKTDEDSKKIREASSASFVDEGDVFNEGIDSSGCRDILFNCLKNLEAKIMEIYERGKENKNMHIKGEKQLVDPAESVKFMTSKFDELEKDQKEKEKIINNLRILRTILRKAREIGREYWCTAAILWKKLFTSPWHWRK